MGREEKDMLVKKNIRAVSQDLGSWRVVIRICVFVRAFGGDDGWSLRRRRRATRFSRRER